jgi:hypothetical protein
VCQIGDIIVIENYIGEDGALLTKHSFIVIRDQDGTVEGFPYDLVTNVMSSFRNKTPEYKAKKLSHQENLGIKPADVILNKPGNSEEGYIKADKLYFFQKTKMQYYVIGNLRPEVFDTLMDLLESLQKQGILKNVTINLK